MSLAATSPAVSPRACPVCGSRVAGACERCGWLEWFRWEDADDVQVFSPMGNLLHAEPFQKFNEAFTPRPGTRLVFDFTDVQYMSSAALSKLLALRKKLRGVGQPIVLRAVHPDLWEVFRVTRLDSYFEIEE